MDIKSAIRYCESGGSYTVVNSIGAGGAYQFMPSTWRGLGYSGVAQNASPATQDAAFDKLYAQQGTSPWVSSKACWSKLVGSNTSLPKTTTSVTKHASAKVAKIKPTYSQHKSVAPTQTSRSLARTVVAPSATSTASASDLRGAVTVTPVTLTKAEQAVIDQATKIQKHSEWWTKQAAAGKTITRHVVGGSGLKVYTHADASTTSAQTGSLAKGDSITGHYLNVDWFAITSGEHAGSFVSTNTLARNVSAHDNGKLDVKTLAKLPENMKSYAGLHNEYVNAGTLKSFIQMNAAYRAHFGHDLRVNESYRDFATQAQYRKADPKLAAVAGDSNHGLGIAFDIAGAYSTKSPTHQWLMQNASAYGFENPKDIAASGDHWHFENVG